VTFKIVKTEFHSGRIEIVYIPQEPLGPNGQSATSSTATNRAYVHREIVDIRSGTQIDILLPYVSIVPWRVLGDVLGSMQVYVVNELLAPPTVSSSITFLVEVAGGPDFQVNIPRNHSMVPVIPTAPQMSFRTKGNDHAIVTEELGNSSNPDVTLLESRVCIGEQIMSFNSLLKKAEIFLSYTPTALLPTLAVDPFSTPVSLNLSGAIVSGEPGSFADNYTVICQCYGMVRGGVRIRSIPTTNSSTSLTPVTSFLGYNTSGTYNGSSLLNLTYSNNSHYLNVTQNQIYTGGSEIQIPQYLQTHSRVVMHQHYSNTIENRIWLRSAQASHVLLYINTSEPLSSVLKRQVADDFQLGFFIGVPSTLNE
jgi:hypothetical protein